MTLISTEPRFWTRDEYHRLAEMGVFDGERVELFRGEIVPMSPQDPTHAGAVENLGMLLAEHFAPQRVVRIQLPLAAPDNSEPEPDALLVDKDYALACRQEHKHPGKGDLVVEVARTSLAYDRLEKLALYAEAGIPQYWIVNLVDKVVEVYENPVTDEQNPFGWSYGDRQEIDQNGSLTFDQRSLPVAALFSGLT